MLHKITGKLPFLFAASLLVALPGIANAEMVYNRGNRGDLASLDINKMQTVQESHIARDIYEGLVEYDTKSNIIPGVAESWTLSADGLIYTFKLRKNAKWSNGDPVTANDFVYAWRRELEPATGAIYASNLYPVKNAEAINKGEMKPEELGIKAIDDYTLEMTLKGPTPFFVELMSHHSAYPQHRASIEKHGADWVKPGNIVTNGAYVPVEFIPKDHLKLVKNKHFHEADTVKIDVVNYIPFDDQNSALKRFEAGEIDSNDDIPVEQMSYMKEHLKDEMKLYPLFGSYYYHFRCDKPPFDNVKLRRALSLAVDRDYLADKIWNNTMFAAYSLVPPGISGYQTRYYDFKDMSQLDREEEAKKLMTELGYGPEKPLKLEIRYNTGENHKNNAVAVADMFKRIHVETSLINTDGKTHYDYLKQKGDYDLARAGWSGDYKDPESFIALGQTNNSNNYSVYSNKEADSYLEQAALEPDAAKRNELLGKAEEVMLRENPMLVMFYYGARELVAKKVRGFEPNPLQIHPTRWMWIDNARS